MILATENVWNRRRKYIISCMNVPKQSQLVQKNDKVILWCAQVTRWCGDWTSRFENFISDLRNAPKRLRKTVMSKPLATKVSTPLRENVQIGPKVSICCVAIIIFQHCLNPLGHGVHQIFTGCHWSPLPLLHDDITELMDVRVRRTASVRRMVWALTGWP